MCGIAGIVDWSGRPARAIVAEMVERLRHRGPDARQVTELGAATLGHARLSVIDVSPEANQPMSDADGRIWIVFNGEIYNFRALRAELEALGHRFRTRSDTEVILASYRQWGDACVERFNGMFAFALWDAPRARLLLARDRLGKKPLFYRLSASGVAFASELPALAADPEVSQEIDPAAVRQFMALGYVLGSSCITRGVLKLPPGHVLAIERGKSTAPRSYWDLAAAFRNKRSWRSEREALEALGALFRDSVRLRLESDVPLGAFLSGGVDSSLIVAVMGRDLKRDNLNTFSAGFHAKSYDESGQARAVARFLGVHHHDETIEADGLAELPMLMRRAGEPFADNSLMPTYHLSALARRHVTVSFSGDGGDELFLGYDTYLADRLHRAAGMLPKPVLDLAAGAIAALLPVSFAKVSFDYKLRQFLAARGSDAAHAHYSWRTLFDTAEARTLLRPGRGAEESDPYLAFKRLYDELAGCHDLDRASYVDIKTWLVDDILVKVDRASMAHGLEARAPFLDHRLVEFAASLSPDLKLRGLRTKYLLKRLHRQYLPARLRARRKRGFNAPVSIWLGAKGADAARAFTSSSSVLDWVDRASVDRLWADHVAGRRDNGYRLFAIACFGAWLESRVQDRAMPAGRKESHLAH